MSVTEVKFRVKIGIRWTIMYNFGSDSKCGQGRTEGRNCETVEIGYEITNIMESGRTTR